jgi:hypothetical protein
MNRIALLASLAIAALASSACSPVVLSGTNDGADPEPSAPGASSSDGAQSTVLAMRYADYHAPNETADQLAPEFSTWPADPDTLLLFISTTAQACDAPVIEAEQPTGGSSVAPYGQLMLAIPPELNHPGLIDLTDYRVMFYEATMDTDGGGQGTGGGFRGTLEIVSSDASGVSFTLDEPPSQGWRDLSGSYTAAFCGAAPPASSPAAALAIQGSKLPPSPDGVTIDPDAMYVITGEGATCDAPWVDVACTGASQVAFTLPTTDGPGAVPIAYAASTESMTACDGGDMTHGTLTDGQATVVANDAASITVKLYGANAQPSGVFDADGLYRATYCP